MDIKEARAALDRIDRQIASLFCERLRIIDQIAALKRTSGMAVHQPQREAEVLHALLSGQEAGYREDLRALYEQIFEISRDRQRRALEQPGR